MERAATDNAWPRLLALAGAAGSLRQGALEMSARDEAHLDLFVEQACGPWLGAALLSAFHVGLEAGLSPLGLLSELYLSGEMAETFAEFAQEGFLRSTQAHGYAAAFGGMTRSLAIDRQTMARQMRGVLAEIQSGEFAAALQAAQKGPEPCLIRIETQAGHGAGKPTAKLIEEAADTLAFMLDNLGVAWPGK